MEPDDRSIGRHIGGQRTAVVVCLTGGAGAECGQVQIRSGVAQTTPEQMEVGRGHRPGVDKDDNVWVLNRPNDLTDIELEAELTPPLADCCVRPPAMIHIDKNGDVIGSFDAPQGHGMAVDSKGFVYIGQDTVRKYDSKTGTVVGEVPRTPERPPGGGADALLTSAHVPGRGSARPVAGF